MLKRFILICLFSTPAFGQSSEVLVPLTGHGLGFETTFTVVNISATTTRVEIEAFSDVGAPLSVLEKPASPFEPASATDRLGLELAGLGNGEAASLGANPESLQVGWARVTSDGPIGVEVVFRRRDAEGRLLTSASVLPQPSSSELSLIAFANPFARTGLALLNGGNQAASVEAFLFNRFGELLGVRELVIGPQSRIQQFVDEDSFFPELFGRDFTGSIEIRSSSPLAVTVIKLEGGAQAFFTTQTVQPARPLN
ncbi:MAG TPA: hypothetical protein VMN76_11220 [Acidobacteriota bacterium]|nr:hypothetical protein [Acidobacteriota bacterium]